MTSPPSASTTGGIGRGQWMALIAAILGWLFDGLEMGLFPLVGRPALKDLLPNASEPEIGGWFAIAMAVFLVGAATGGVLFGWLGDRIGRVRAMMLSVFTYAIFTGLCGVAQSAEQIAVLRFIAALGMGGEWSLGVALVNEIWPDRSRAFLAALIGASANVGFLLIGLVGKVLIDNLAGIHEWLLSTGLDEQWANALVANSGWRLMLILGAVPALLTFFIRLFVPESERWQHEQGRGTTSHWAARDLLGVAIGAAAACAIMYLWSPNSTIPLVWQIIGSLAALVVATCGYIYPVMRYLQRRRIAEAATPAGKERILTRMLLGACLGGVALLGTWGSIQWAPIWVDKLTEGAHGAKEATQIWSALGAITGTILGAYACNWIGRRPAYVLLCIGSFASILLLYRGNDVYGTRLLTSVYVGGLFTAAFYGWLPLYLPELFPTRVRATGQGFSYNFGRILAAVGALQTGSLMRLLGGADTSEAQRYAIACSTMAGIYIVGVIIIWLAPETRGKLLPE